MSNIEDVRMKPEHNIRDMIHISLELAEYTKLPFLFLGNPGIAKTTNIRSWADRRGYKVVSLIGSQRTAEEVLGYMVNTGKRLETFTPDWFDEIYEYEEAGHKTVLFIDELSTAPENVQGAMLQLIFDRKVGGRNYLPESTLVVAAANYKGNLPPQNRIMAPTLNRFVIVNLEATDNKSFFSEFLINENARLDDMIEAKNNEITPATEEICRENMLIMMSTLCQNFAVEETKNKDVFDVNNQNYDEIYDRDGKVYNFISGRSVYYLYKLSLGLINKGFARKPFASKISNLLLGLIGNGTNTFTTEEARNEYRSGVILLYQRVLKQTVNSVKLKGQAVDLDYSNMKVGDAINQWVLHTAGDDPTFDNNLKNLITHIESTYSADVLNMGKVLGTLNTNDAIVDFSNDIQKLTHLISILDSVSLADVQPFRARAKVMQEAWLGYSNMLLEEAIGA